MDGRLRGSNLRVVRFTPWAAGLAGIACLAMVVASCSGAATTVTAPPGSSTNVAEQALAAFNAAFYAGTPSSGFYKRTSRGGQADFWREAEMIETAEDYAQITDTPGYRRLVVALCQGLLGRYGTSWVDIISRRGLGRLGPRADDDVMWMTIAFARAGAITGHRSYTAVAKANFDVVFSRAWSNDFGGGLWWRVGRHQRREKNVTTNAPAVIAACELYLNLHQASYLAKAERVYAWLRRHLYNPRSGRLYDAVWWTNAHTPHFRVTRFTYNQGSFIGAACLLHAITGRKVYFDDALRALHYTQDNLTTGGILQNDALHANMDRGGFKGIFARWALTFARENHLSTFDAWFRLNATTAWSHRNAAGLMGYDWLVTPRNGPQFSFDCSSGVAMMEYLLPHGTP